MPEPDEFLDEESIPRYQRGFEWYSHLANTQMADRPWKRLGIFSFYDAPFAASERLYLSPKQVMAVMAQQAKHKETGLVFVADALERAEMGLGTKQGFDQFMEIFNRLFPGAVKFYFGPRDSERTYMHDYPSLKIPLTWLIKRPNLFAEVLSDASPVQEDIGPGDASFEDFEGMIEVLIDKLGPPSLTEEVLGKIKSTEASDYAGEAVGLMTVFVSPTAAVSRGVKYLGKFASLLRERRKQEVKEVYREWEERVTKGYAEENLRKFFDPDPEYNSGLEEAVAEFKPVLLITETRGTLFDLFLPLVLQHLVEKIGFIPSHKRPRRKPKPEHEQPIGDYKEEMVDDDSLVYEDPSETGLPPVTDLLIQTVLKKELTKLEDDIEMSDEEYEGKPETILFLDAVTHLSKFRRSFRFALNIPEKYPNVSVAASFFTNRESFGATLQEGILEYMTERALIFDFHPLLFDLATARMPISKKVWLESKLQELERLRSEGGVAFLEFYNQGLEQWTLRAVEEPDRGAIETIRRWFGSRG